MTGYVSKATKRFVTSVISSAASCAVWVRNLVSHFGGGT